MAIEAMSHVWKHSKQSKAKLLLMLALADSANAEDWSCYPSIRHIARKARLSENYASDCLQDLAAQGEIEIERFAGAVTPKGPTNRYYILKDGQRVMGGESSGPGGNSASPMGGESSGRGVKVSEGGAGTFTPITVVDTTVSKNDSNEDEDSRARARGSAVEDQPQPTTAEQPANAYAAVFTEWERVGGLITPQLRDDLVEFTNEYGAQWVSEAIANMGRSGVRTPNANYLRKVLDGWRRNGYGWRPNAAPRAPAGPNHGSKPSIPSEQVTGQVKRVRPEDIPSLFKRAAAGGD